LTDPKTKADFDVLYSNAVIYLRHQVYVHGRTPAQAYRDTLATHVVCDPDRLACEATSHYGLLIGEIYLQKLEESEQ